MTKQQVTKELEKNKNYYLTDAFLKEISKYYEVVHVSENKYFIPYFDYEIQIM